MCLHKRVVVAEGKIRYNNKRVGLNNFGLRTGVSSGEGDLIYEDQCIYTQSKTSMELVTAPRSWVIQGTV